MGEANTGWTVLSPIESVASSPGVGRLTPESSDGDRFSEGRGNLVADPLLGGQADEVYELSERARVGRRGEGAGAGGEEKPQDELVYTAEEEQAVVRKFDRRLVLFVALLYMLSFLDRSSSSYPPVLFSCYAWVAYS